MRVTHVTARPGITLLAMTENHIRTSSMGFQCVVQCCYEQNAPSQTWMSPSFPVQTLYRHPILHSGPHRQGRACARGGGGGGILWGVGGGGGSRAEMDPAGRAGSLNPWTMGGFHHPEKKWWRAPKRRMGQTGGFTPALNMNWKGCRRRPQALQTPRAQRGGCQRAGLREKAGGAFLKVGDRMKNI